MRSTATGSLLLLLLLSVSIQFQSKCFDVLPRMLDEPRCQVYVSSIFFLLLLHYEHVFRHHKQTLKDEKVKNEKYKKEHNNKTAYMHT